MGAMGPLNCGPFPEFPLEYILYAEDDEFPAQLIITFDRTIDRHLPLDVIWALVNVTTQRILKAGDGAKRTEKDKHRTSNIECLMGKPELDVCFSFDVGRSMFDVRFFLNHHRE